MSKFNSFKFKYWSDIDTIQQLINEWKPVDCVIEKDYENSLYEFLRSSLPGIMITPQYGYGRARTDIAVSDRVAIEIKKDLDDTSEYHRLIGQAFQFKDWKDCFLILLVGITDKNLFDELQKKVNDLNYALHSSVSPKIFIINK